MSDLSSSRIILSEQSNSQVDSDDELDSFLSEATDIHMESGIEYEEFIGFLTTERGTTIGK